MLCVSVVNTTFSAPSILKAETIYPVNEWMSEQMNVHAQLFSHIQLFATPWTVAHQAPLSLGFFKQEWVAIFSSRGSPQPRDQTYISCVS